MSKRKQIKKSYTTSILSAIVAIAFCLSAGYFTYGIVKTYTSDEFSVNSDQVWCANCQTYHDKQTAEEEKEQNKLVWCINCNKYHEPRDESK